MNNYLAWKCRFVRIKKSWSPCRVLLKDNDCLSLHNPLYIVLPCGLLTPQIYVWHGSLSGKNGSGMTSFSANYCYLYPARRRSDSSCKQADERDGSGLVLCSALLISAVWEPWIYRQENLLSYKQMFCSAVSTWLTVWHLEHSALCMCVCKCSWRFCYIKCYKKAVHCQHVVVTGKDAHYNALSLD